MTKNVGGIDRILRIVVGLALLAYAIFLPQTGWNWVGWIGVVPLLTGLFNFCPVYTLLGVNTCPMKTSA
jgi:membrane-associated protease RseP (regulator of RpoE activity)